MDEVNTCRKCGSTLAVDGLCLQCDEWMPEPPSLDEYGYQQEDQPREAGPGRHSDVSCDHQAQTRGGRVLPFPALKRAPMTPEELYADAMDHKPMTPARAAQVARTVAELTKRREDDRPKLRVVMKPKKDGA